jgi:hypothetical protein
VLDAPVTVNGRSYAELYVGPNNMFPPEGRPCTVRGDVYEVREPGFGGGERQYAVIANGMPKMQAAR